MGRLIHAGRSRTLTASALLAGLMALVLLGPGGCARPEPTTTGAPPVTYTGPEVLRGTVRSLCRIRQYEPLLVSGYGIVVGLDGTGSSEVPAHLERHMLNYARQMGVGDSTMERHLPEEFRRFARMSPRELLQRSDTALVAVEGLVPPGAANGTTFDVVVSALDQTQTTSLAGGVLWTTELSVGGINPAMPFSHIVAKAHGPIYVDPFEREADADASTRSRAPQAADRRMIGPGEGEHFRQATIINGARTTERRRIELILNQPSWQRSRDIADRINERFPVEPHERVQTANAISPHVIELNIPERFTADPTRLTDLIAHLYIQRGRNFEPYQAQELAQALRENGEDEQFTEAVILAWRALGRTIIPTLRQYYSEENLNLRLSALQAGAHLQDERASLHLASLASHPDMQVRIRVAEALTALPDSNRGRDTLRHLFDDEQSAVRLAAYEAAALTNDGELIDRYAIRGPNGYTFVIDRVEAERPMIYVTHSHMPRLVIFGPEQNLGFNMPMLARLWNNRLMIHSEEEDVLNVYYQPPRQIEGKTFKLEPSVATLAFLLGHHPDRSSARGLGLSFSEVVHIIHQLCQNGDIEASFEFQGSPMAELVRQRRQQQEEADEGRPEIGSPEELAPQSPDAAAGTAPQRQPTPPPEPLSPAAQRPDTHSTR